MAKIAELYYEVHRGVVVSQYKNQEMIVEKGTFLGVDGKQV